MNFKERVLKNFSYIIRFLIIAIFVFIAFRYLVRFQTDQFDGMKYHFSDTNQQEYLIKTNFSHLFLFNKNTQEQKLNLIFFLDQQDKNAMEYLQTLNNLQKDNHHLRVLAILSAPMEKSELKNFIQSHKINFLILLPKDKKNIAQDFISYFQNIEEYYKENSPTHGEKTSFVSPLLILYDKHGRLYQHYQGAIPEEMFVFDIQQIQGE